MIARRYKRRALSLVLGTFCSLHLRAATSTRPTGFMGVPWRATQSEVVKVLGHDDCTDSGGYSWCSADLDLSEHVRTTARFYFEGGRFGEATVTFRSRDYDFVKRVFLDRYGSPAQRKVVEVRTAMNVPYANEILFWTWNGANASLMHYADSVNDGIGSVQADWYTAAREKREHHEARSASRTLDAPPPRSDSGETNGTTSTESAGFSGAATETDLFRELSVAPGMTIDDVTAKIGSPQRTETGWYSGIRGEKWLYENFGYALIFASSDRTLRGIEALSNHRSPPAKDR